MAHNRPEFKQIHTKEKRENLEAMTFIKELNKEVYRSFPDVQTIAEESTSFPSACLPEQHEDLPVGTHCMIIGWGKKKSSHVYGTEVLHEAEVIIYIMLSP